MTVAARQRQIPTGSAAPRVAPPRPVKSLRDDLAQTAAKAGIDLWPWQRTAATYLMARQGDRWRYREVAIVVARQNGKTELLVPRILWGLEQGRRIIHTAQNRSLPRDVFERVAWAIDPKTLKKRVRYANGQEKIVTRNGGVYQIVAPQRGARGLSGDDLIIDEVREFEDYDFVNAAAPTLTASADPQIIYLSNAGDDKSVVLNDLRDKADSEWLAYIEWSADPELDAGDPTGWAQANPALGHKAGIWETLQHDYATKPPTYWETEHLCRWVSHMSPGLVTDIAWRQCQTDELGKPFRASLGVALDPSGKRASAAIAWTLKDGTVAYQPLLEVEDETAIDVDAFGQQLRQLSMRHRIRQTGYSGATDVAVARYLSKAKTVDGRLHAQASANFATLVEAGKLRWVESDALTADLRYTVRKDHNDGAWSAVRSEDDRPITAALAAIRATWLASAPRPPAPRIG